MNDFNGVVQLPTIFLPPIKKIPSSSLECLNECVSYLRALYNPPVRGSRRIHAHLEPRKSALASETENHTLANIGTDTFERAYAIRWLTAIVAHADAIEQGSFGLSSGTSVIEQAAALLAICSGTSAAGIITRTFDFPMADDFESKRSVEIIVRDVPLENQDYGSVGCQTWGGACVLSEMIAAQPENFGFSFTDSTTLRVLELGAGTGLVSLTVGKVFQALCRRLPHLHVEVVATDFYPSVLKNIQENIKANFSSAASKFGNDSDDHHKPSDPLSMSSHFLDWSIFPSVDVKQAPFDRPFDIVLGADIIYEREHAEWIRNCLASLLKKPGNAASSPSTPVTPLFHLVIPLRTTHTSESNTISELFRHASGVLDRDMLHLCIVSEERIPCMAEEDGNEIVEYAYYKIGWC
jgi:predicted nicotinamide N-methyase